MCGIFSVFLSAGVHDPLLREKAFQCSRRQRHRGPDSTGVQCGEDYCIVQERLSIIGVATGRQPLLSSDGKVMLAANGEIYNYKELAELISLRRGMAYTPRSDSDVIMALYEEFGHECASMLWGMFAFVLYNKETKEIFCARDGLGICSLYFGVARQLPSSTTDEEAQGCSREGATVADSPAAESPTDVIAGESASLNGRLYIASEMKCIPCDEVYTFPPGTYLAGKVDDFQFKTYFKPQWSSLTIHPGDPVELATRLELSVKYHLNSDVPVACFLSGGVNSSIIAALAAKIMKESVAPLPAVASSNGPHSTSNAGTNRLKTYTIGLTGSSDIEAARVVAAHLDTEHTEVTFTPEEGIDLIPELIWHLETYDPFIIRAAIPMYILSRVVRSAGIKVILAGEGADEIFGGHLYFHAAPSAEEFRQETVKRLMDVHLSDGLRANKTSMAQSVELRAPFLGSPFVNYAMTIVAEDRMPKPRSATLEIPSRQDPPSGALSGIQSPQAHSQCPQTSQCVPAPERRCELCNMRSLNQEDGVSTVADDGPNVSSSLYEASDDCQVNVEKWLLRKATEDLLPEEIIWRQKEQFCDGVGEAWVAALQQHAEERISDAEFSRRFERFPHNTPNTKEEFLYRRIFAMEYPGEQRAKTVVMWKPKWVTVGDTTGRANPLHYSKSLDSAKDDAPSVVDSPNAPCSAECGGAHMTQFEPLPQQSSASLV